MLTLKINRMRGTDFGGRLGVLRVGAFTCFTIERRWLDNKRNVSCIPTGTYALRVGNFRGRYPDLELLQVPNRSNIEIHGANRYTQLQGCIAPGLSAAWDEVTQSWAVSRSRAALTRILFECEGEASLSLVIE